LNQVPGRSDAELEQERILYRLDQLIRGLTPIAENDVDPSAAAHHLYENFLMAEGAAREKRKSGRASLTRVAKELKDVASGSKTLLKRLKQADRNVFDSWAGAVQEDANATPVEKWLQLKALLQETVTRATRSSQTAEAVVKVCLKAKASSGRPEDLVAAATTLMAACIYEEWTGKIAVRSISRDDGSPGGEFHNFLTEVFRILGITASPDYSNDRLQKELAKLRNR
jgi:hypothetical protein